jgi:hypothetical protein
LGDTVNISAGRSCQQDIGQDIGQGKCAVNNLNSVSRSGEVMKELKLEHTQQEWRIFELTD